MPSGPKKKRSVIPAPSLLTEESDDRSKTPEKSLLPSKRQREKQAVKIARTAAEVWEVSAKDAQELAFVSRILVQAFLPHSDPKDIGWTRTNGNFSLDVKSGIGKDKKTGKFKHYGVPYGTVPRLILAWLNSEVIRNAQDPKNTTPQFINLGRSLSSFLEKIGVPRTGGARGGITAFKNQAERLFHAEISVSEAGKNYFKESDIKVSDGRFIFWDMKEPSQQTLWESSVKLSDSFYQLLLNNPVPLDWRILKCIKQSPMALDLYMWLTHRMSYLQKPVSIRWETLQGQLGSDVERIDHFREKVRKHLKKITTIWAGLQIDASQSDELHLYPTHSLTIPTKTKSLTASKKSSRKRAFPVQNMLNF